MSEKGVRDSVFLRSAYDGYRLKRVDELTEVMEEMRLLVLLGKKGTRRESGQTIAAGEESEDEDDEEEGWNSEDEWEESDGERQGKRDGDMGEPNMHVREVRSKDSSAGTEEQEVREKW